MKDRLHIGWLFVFGIALAVLGSWVTSAQAAPAVSIAVNPATGIAPYQSTLTWGSTGAISCTASDGWTGSKATSGTQAVTISAAAKFTLTCTAADGATTITWTPPTQNTDGSTLTDLAGINLYRGTTQANVARVKSVGPVSTTTDTGLASGSYVYTATAVNSASVESDKGNFATAVVMGSSASVSAVAAIQTKPNPPTSITATVTAYEYRPSTNTFAAIGLVPPGAPCGPETKTSGATTYCRVALADSLPVVWPQNRALTEVWARQ